MTLIRRTSIGNQRRRELAERQTGNNVQLGASTHDSGVPIKASAPEIGAPVIETTVNTAAVAKAMAKFHASAPTMEQPEELRLQLGALAEDCFYGNADVPIALRVLDGLFESSPVDLPSLALKGRDLVFARNLLALQPYVAARGLSPAGAPPTQRTDRSEDCLADNVDEWSVFRVLNLAAMGSIPTTRRVAIVTSIRNEGLSILEWLAHHRAMGFDTFYVYTNDNTDNSDDLLQTLDRHGIIHLVRNEVGEGVKVQTKILEHSLHCLPELRACRWALYIDVDEFFICRCEPGLTLDTFYRKLENSFPSDPPSAVAFNWKWFGSENAFELTEGFLLERFVHSIHNEHVKSLVNLRHVVSMHRVHVPVLMKDTYLVNSDFVKTSPSVLMSPTYGTGQLNHYWNKSFQEFMLKRARGRISQGLGAPPLDSRTFFDWGANGQRGNFDMPPERILARLKEEFNSLSALPEVEVASSKVRLRFAEMLKELDAEVHLAGLYQRRGRTVLDDAI